MKNGPEGGRLAVQAEWAIFHIYLVLRVCSLPHDVKWNDMKSFSKKYREFFHEKK
jgi:hypothetical protein